MTSALARVFSLGEEIAARVDSWTNVALGFGTSRDKTMQGAFLSGCRIFDQELAALYTHDHVAQKIVNIYPREAMREGYCLQGFDADVLKKAADYLEPFALPQLITDSWIWSRLFGGGAIWAITDDGAIPAQPLIGPPKNIMSIRFVDRRFLQPYTWYETGPKVGQPETYMLFAFSGISAKIGVIHESRLILFPGARTEALAKREVNGWDYSVLQVAYDELRSDGNVWKAIELLVSDANQGVFKISNLWSMVAGTKGNDLKARVQMMDITRSVARSILIDKDKEEFERMTTNFAGLADLSDRSLKRVASAAEIPVTVLLGESPAGLNATGDSDLRWFFARIASEQKQTLQPRIMQLLKMILGAEGSPLKGQDLSKLDIKWHPLWSPTAKERAEIGKLEADTDHVYITDEVATPEEVAVSRFGGEDPGATKINVAARQRVLDLDEATSSADFTAKITAADPNAQDKDQATALNGTQIASMLQIVLAVATKEIPRDTGIAMLVAAFPISTEQAEEILGTVGKSFFSEPKPAPQLPGGAPPAPGQKPPAGVPPEKPPANGGE